MSYRMGNEIVQGSLYIAIQFLFHQYTAFFFIIVICAVMAVTLACFCLYHCSMIAEGVSTNEKIKKSDIKHALEQELKSIDQKLKIAENDADVTKQLQSQKKSLNKEFQKIENCFRKGFWTNLKEIFSL